LQTSLTLQTAILTDQLEWEEWKNVPGTMIPTQASVDKLIPDFYEKYNPALRQNAEDYIATLTDRFQQRIDYLKESDVKEKPELLEHLIKSLRVEP
ncbi:MAG: phosphoenolpyruvate carboxykinase, partial [Candidatus Cloacimonadaceae bacterium]